MISTPNLKLASAWIFAVNCIFVAGASGDEDIVLQQPNAMITAVLPIIGKSEVVAIEWSGAIRTWDLDRRGASGIPIHSGVRSNLVRSSEDKSRVFCCGSIWDFRTGERMALPSSWKSAIQFDISGSGSILVAKGDRGGVRVGVQSSDRRFNDVGELEGSSEALSVRLSRTGKWAIALLPNNVIKRWRLEDRSISHTLQLISEDEPPLPEGDLPGLRRITVPNPGAVVQIDVLSDDDTLAMVTADESGIVDLILTSSSIPMGRVRIYNIYQDGLFRSLWWSDNGRIVAIGGDANFYSQESKEDLSRYAIKLLDLETGLEYESYRGHKTPVAGMFIDGRLGRIVSWSRDTIRIGKISKRTEELVRPAIMKQGP